MTCDDKAGGDSVCARYIGREYMNLGGDSFGVVGTSRRKAFIFCTFRITSNDDEAYLDTKETWCMLSLNTQAVTRE